jgi:hypothetical protein
MPPALAPSYWLKSFTWRGVGAFVLFAAALSAWSWSGLLLTSKTLTFEEHADYFLSIFQRTLLQFFPLYLLVVVVDGLPLKGRRRLVALGAAVVAGALLSVQVRCAIAPSQMLYVYESLRMPYCTSFPTWRTYIDFPSTYLFPLTMGALVTVFILGRRRDAELLEALRAARASQIEARRTRIEAEIAAMHSRVDPDALLETLRTVRARYEESLSAGEARLDALIRDLRLAAQPPAGATDPGPA